MRCAWPGWISRESWCDAAIPATRRDKAARARAAWSIWRTFPMRNVFNIATGRAMDDLTDGMGVAGICLKPINLVGIYWIYRAFGCKVGELPSETPMQNTARARETAPIPLVQDPALTLLRLLMRQCRAKARVEVFETCRLLLHSPREGVQDYADALLRILSTALPKGPVIHDLRAHERSFDEEWLLALFAALQRDDHCSATFLLRARLPRHLRRPVGWLASELVQRMAVMTEQNPQD